MYYESGFDPKAYNSSGGYYGLCQWGGSRKERLYDYCAGLGLSAGSIEGQLKFIQYELQTNESSAWAKMKAIGNTDEGAYDAGWQWAQYYERCASSHYYERAYRAQHTYWPKYHGTSVPTPAPTPAPTTAPIPTPAPTIVPTMAPVAPDQNASSGRSSLGAIALVAGGGLILAGAAVVGILAANGMLFSGKGKRRR